MVMADPGGSRGGHDRPRLAASADAGAASLAVWRQSAGQVRDQRLAEQGRQAGAGAAVAAAAGPRAAATAVRPGPGVHSRHRIPAGGRALCDQGAVHGQPGQQQLVGDYPVPRLFQWHRVQGRCPGGGRRIACKSPGVRRRRHCPECGQEQRRRRGQPARPAHYLRRLRRRDCGAGAHHHRTAPYLPGRSIQIGPARGCHGEDRQVPAAQAGPVDRLGADSRDHPHADAALDRQRREPLPAGGRLGEPAGLLRLCAAGVRAGETGD